MAANAFFSLSSLSQGVPGPGSQYCTVLLRLTAGFPQGLCGSNKRSPFVSFLPIEMWVSPSVLIF